MVKMGTVWDRTSEFVSDNLAALMPIALIAIFVPVSAIQSLTPLMGPGGDDRSFGLGLTLFLLSILSIIGRMAVVAMALDIADDARTAARIALSRLPAFVVVGLIFVVPFMLLFVPIVFILKSSGVRPEALTSMPFSIPDAAATPLMLYGLLVVCLIFWAFARLLPMVPVIIAERRWFGAIGRAFGLTRGTTLKIVGVILLYMLVSTVSSMAAKTVFGSILHLVAGNDDVVNVATVLTSIIVAAVGTAFQVLAAAFTAKLYLALRAEKEGGVAAA